jgi:23S rRNA (guanine2445-N2)-methyltransferase / 23S rRNA (guanine2069-N7)-methyltransferase
MPRRLPLFATTARGTEELLAEELTELGAAKVRRDRGGVRFFANLNEAMRVLLWSRIAMRVLYPVGQGKAEGAQGLYQATYAIPWEEHLTARSTFAVDAAVKDTEHTHSGFVALKIKDAIADRLRDKLGARPDVDPRHPVVAVVAHLAGNELDLSLDLAGAPLHRRGYRAHATPAPLKETLAASMLRAARYRGEEPLLDPMCGSGTLLIEGGLIATRSAPGLGRAFAVERWPMLGQEASAILDELRREARAQRRRAPCPIVGFDWDPEALDAARRNVRAAGLSAEIQLGEADATGPFEVPKTPGLLATNPPYGERLKGGGGQQGMKTFYFKLGERLRALEGWRLAVLAGNPGFESAFHLRPRSKKALWNGPIECALLEYTVPRLGTSR